MPIFPGSLIPLSSFWTPELIVGHIRSLLNEHDNERIQDLTIRYHLNVAIGTVAQQLNIANEPWYGFRWSGQLDTLATSSNPGVINLNTSLPYIWSIDQISVGPYGNCPRVSSEEAYTIGTGINKQWSQSIVWSHHGQYITIAVGRAYLPPAGPSTPFIVDSSTVFTIMGLRNPDLDDLAPPAASAKYNLQKIDLPDRHIRLLILIIQKMCLEQLNKQVPVDIEQAISGMMNQILEGKKIATELRMAERIKAQDGFQTR